jgi:predicted TIM-barrel fold metal-dependent hydrolase
MVTEGGRHGVDRWIVFPMVANLWFDPKAMRAGKLAPGGFEAVPYAYENERMLREIYELFPDLGRRTLPFAILDPVREPAAQIAALRALYKQFPFFGLKIQATMIQADAGALLTTGRGFLELAEELDLPMLIHTSVGGDDPWSDTGLLLKIAAATPRVRFCLAHSCRFDRVYLDRVAEMPNTWFDCSAHRIHCVGAVQGMKFIAPKDRRFAADYRDPTAVLQALAAAYPTKLMWGSDSPFQSYVAKTQGTLMSLRSTYEEEVDCFKALPPQAQTLSGQDNIIKYLKLKDESILTRG